LVRRQDRFRELDDRKPPCVEVAPAADHSVAERNVVARFTRLLDIEPTRAALGDEQRTTLAFWRQEDVIVAGLDQL
jgi:hypothetical protein